MSLSRASTFSQGLKDTLNDDDELRRYQDFRSNYAQDVHKSLAIETEYDKQRTAFKVPLSYLGEILSSCQASDPRLKTCGSTWGNVLQLIKDSVGEYEAKGNKSKVRAWFRKSETVAIALGGMTELIPGDNGLDVLRGALAFIFMTWKTRIQNRERILLALHDIPYVVFVAQERWKAHTIEEKLLDDIREFYKELMDAVTDLIEILLRQKDGPEKKALPASLLRGIKRRWPQLNETQAVNGILDRIVQVKSEIERYSNLLDQRRADKTHLNTNELLREVTATRKTTHEAKYEAKYGFSVVADNLKGVGETLQVQHQENHMQLESMQTIMSELHQDMRDRRAEKKRFSDTHFAGHQNIPAFFLSRRDTEDSQTNLYYLLAEQVYKQGLFIATNLPIAKVHSSTMTRDRLLNFLDIPALLPLADRDQVLNRGRKMPPDSLGHGRYLLSVNQFQQFLRNQASGVLLVDGHCQDMCEGRISPVSVFCASLAATLAQYPPCMVLHFFCGQHTRYKEKMSGPRGLLKNIIYQILLYPDQPEPHLGWMTENLARGVEKGEITALCQILEHLVQQISSVQMIYCILDNVADFESASWAPEMVQILECLHGLVGNSGSAPYLKVLMTCSSSSRKLVRSIDPSEHLSLRSGNVFNSDKSFLAISQDIQGSVTPMATD